MKPNIPEHLLKQEQVKVPYHRIACMADHPKVYYGLNKDGYVVCGYCSKLFVACEQTDFTSEEVYIYDNDNTEF